MRRNNSPMKDLESRIGLLTRRLNDLFFDNFSSDISLVDLCPGIRVREECVASQHSENTVSEESVK